VTLKKGDAVVGMDIIPDEKSKAEVDLLVVMSKGFGKRTDIGEYRLQGRGGSGIKTANITAKTGHLISAHAVDHDSTLDLLVVSDSGQIIRTPLKSVSQLGRDTQGVRIMRFKDEKDSIASVTLV
jgi:DNA gyrase subunit A